MISVRAACVDGVVLLRLRLRRVHRDVDAGSEHQRRVGVARRIGDREVETGREEVVDEQPVRPPEAQAGHRRDRLRHRASRREGVDVGKLPGLLVRVVRLDDQRAVQVAAVPDPRLVASGARARLLPGPDEGAFAGAVCGSRQRGVHDTRSAAKRHQLELRREARWFLGAWHDDRCPGRITVGGHFVLRGYPPIFGTESSMQIFSARRLGISTWHGTASVAPVVGLRHRECDEPSRLR